MRERSKLYLVAYELERCDFNVVSLNTHLDSGVFLRAVNESDYIQIKGETHGCILKRYEHCADDAKWSQKYSSASVACEVLSGLVSLSRLNNSGLERDSTTNFCRTRGGSHA